MENQVLENLIPSIIEGNIGVRKLAKELDEANLKSRRNYQEY